MKTIAVDIDDVLALSAEGFTEYSNKKWGTNLRPSDYTEHWADMWRVDIAEVDKRTNEWYNDNIVLTYNPKPDGEQVLRMLAKKYKLVVATARGKATQADTIEWVERHYKDIFSEVHHAAIWDTIEMGNYSITKTELCKQIGADYLIDDQLKHCLSANEAGIQAILFGNYTWNQMDTLPKSIVRATSWKQVGEYFDRQ